MNIRFLYKGEQRECESDALLTSLHRAAMEYVCKTGRHPTHLVLGDTEWAQFHGYVQAMTALGMTRELHQVHGLSGEPISQFSGLPLLRSSEASLVMAVEQEHLDRPKECESCGKEGEWLPKGQFDALCPDCGGEREPAPICPRCGSEDCIQSKPPHRVKGECLQCFYEWEGDSATIIANRNAAMRCQEFQHRSQHE